MDLTEFTSQLSDLDSRMKENLKVYHDILKQVGELERNFCSCGFISEWIERGKRESIEDLYTFLISKAHERTKKELPDSG